MTDHENKINRIGYKPPEDAIGERIKIKRKELNLSVEELATLTALYDQVPDSDGVSPPTIYRYEGDKSKPSAREIRLLSLALNVSPCWLITGQEWNQEIKHNAEIAQAVVSLFNIVNYAGYEQINNSERDTKHKANLFEIKITDNLYETPPKEDQ